MIIFIISADIIGNCFTLFIIRYIDIIKHHICKDELQGFHDNSIVFLNIRFSDVEDHLEELMEKSNVGEVNRRITIDILPKHKEFLMSDIMNNYKSILSDIKTFFADIRESQSEVLETSAKNADEIRMSFEKSKKELDDVQAYREQLEIAMNELKANTDERVSELCKALKEMTKSA